MAKDWTQIYRRYKGLWVALLKDEETVVGTGKTAKDASNKAKDSGYKEVYLTHIPKERVLFVGIS